MYRLTGFAPTCASCRFLSYSSSRYSKSSDSYSKSHYDVLGISKHASNDEIKKAYYEQSMLHHPDKKEGNQEKFREITSAYEVLGNVRLRKMYDKGLISSESTIIYETDDRKNTSSEGESSSPEASVSIPALDEWSKAQYSQTFAREQNRRQEARKQMALKNRKGEASSIQKTLMYVGFLVFIGTYIVERFRLSKDIGKAEPAKKK